MKICLVADYIPGFHKKWSGAEIYCHNLFEKLNRENIETHLFTIPFEISQPATGRIVQIRSMLKLDGKIARLFQPMFDPVALLDCYWKFRKIRPDIIHVHSKYLLLPVMISARLLGIKTAYTFLDYFLLCHRNTFLRDDGSICPKQQGVWCAECSRQIIAGLPAQNLLRLILEFVAYYRTLWLTFIIKRINRYFALTIASRKRIVSQGIAAEKIKVNYYYSPTMTTPEKREVLAAKYKLDPSLRYLLFVGSVSYHKGLEILIKAIAIIASKHKNIRLLLGIGDAVPEHLTKIKKLIMDYELSETIIFLPKMENAEVRNMINYSETVIVPEQWPNEFGPVILVEALFYNRPVVASRIGGIPEFVVDGENGYTFIHNDPQNLADKILLIVEDPINYQHLLKNTGESLQKLSICNNDIIENYQEILAKGSID